MNSVKSTVVVVGGGYAGTMAANRLAGDSRLSVTMINSHDHFVERIRLHQWAAGTGEAQRDFGSVLSSKVNRRHDTVTRIDAARRELTVASGASIGYDWLVYAPGSVGRHDASTAIADSFSVTDWESATRLRAELDQRSQSVPVVVIGGGLTGVEIATELANRGRHVVLTTRGAITPSVSARAQRIARARLESLGVDIREHTEIVAGSANAVTLADADGHTHTIVSPITVCATGFSVSTLAVASGLSCDSVGRLRTDSALVSVDAGSIVGAGDAVAPTGYDLRMSCQAAMPLGAQAAATVRALVEGRVPVPIDQGYAGQCVSLGRGGGVVQMTHRDDSPASVVLAGRPAAVVKEIVCRATVWALRAEARWPGSYRWAGRGGSRSVPTPDDAQV